MLLPLLQEVLKELVLREVQVLTQGRQIQLLRDLLIQPLQGRVTQHLHPRQAAVTAHRDLLQEIIATQAQGHHHQEIQDHQTDEVGNSL